MPLDARRLRLGPRLEVATESRGGVDAVEHHGVNDETVHRQPGVGAPGLGDDHVLRGGDQPEGGDLPVVEQLAQPLEPVQQPEHVVEETILGHRDPGQPLERLAEDPHQRSLRRQRGSEQLVEAFRVFQQRQGFAGRCAVHHQDVVASGGGVVEDPQQAEQLAQPGQQQRLLGGERHLTLPDHETRQVVAQTRPRPVVLHQGVDLQGIQAWGDASRFAGQRQAQRITQRMRRVGAHHQDPVSLVRQVQGRGGGDGGLADPALAGVQDDPHAHSSMSIRLGSDGPVGS